MKIIPARYHTFFGDYLEQGCLRGLPNKAQAWAKEQFKKFDKENIPYGIIRKMAQEKFKQ